MPHWPSPDGWAARPRRLGWISPSPERNPPLRAQSSRQISVTGAPSRLLDAQGRQEEVNGPVTGVVAAAAAAADTAEVAFCVQSSELFVVERVAFVQRGVEFGTKQRINTIGRRVRLGATHGIYRSGLANGATAEPAKPS